MPDALMAFRCPECDFEIQSRDSTELVAAVQPHGRVHRGFQITREEVIGMTRAVPE